VPILERVDAPGDGRPQALVVVPTRELAIQVASDIEIAGKTRGVRVLTIYGGRSYEPQVASLKAGVEVVVGTPGRLLDLSRQGTLNLTGVRALVLDEADEMLDLGFLPDVEKIVSQLPTNRQTMLFSATMPSAVLTLSRRYMRQATTVRAEEPEENRTVPTTAQHIFRAHPLDKPEMLARILQANGRGLTIIFTRTKRAADKLSLDLTERGFAAAAVHGDLGQGQREQALRAFRAGKVDVLVATDVAARGIDVKDVTHVVNYTCPEDEKTYLHRIGRTGRAGENGVAITFVDWDDLARWNSINQILALPFPDPPETYSTSDSLYEALDIPRTATGTLPRADRHRAGLDAETLEDLGETGRSRKAPTSKAGGARGAAKTAPVVEGEKAERAPRTPRQRSRTRTRSGQAAAGDAVDAPAASASSESVTTPAGGAGDGPDAPARRRRRRGGRGSGAGAGAGGATADTATD
jgi:superfamily II DNA/RNA helicase